MKKNTIVQIESQVIWLDLDNFRASKPINIIKFLGLFVVVFAFLAYVMGAKYHVYEKSGAVGF